MHSSEGVKRYQKRLDTIMATRFHSFSSNEYFEMYQGIKPRRTTKDLILSKDYAMMKTIHGNIIGPYMFGHIREDIDDGEFHETMRRTNSYFLASLTSGGLGARMGLC